MNRRQERNKRKQEKKVEHIIDKFLKEYKNRVEAVTIPATSKSLTMVKNDVPDTGKRLRQIQENKEADLTAVNSYYMEVWRGLLLHFKNHYPLTRVNTNYFDQFIEWGDKKQKHQGDQVFKIVV